MEKKCKHDYEHITTIKRTWDSGSDGRNGSSSGSSEIAILKCSKCKHIKKITF